LTFAGFFSGQEPGMADWVVSHTPDVVRMLKAKHEQEGVEEEERTGVAAPKSSPAEVDTVSADELRLIDGCLLFMQGDTIMRVYGAGTYWRVERVQH
jgi:hypothetical protein